MTIFNKVKQLYQGLGLFSLGMLIGTVYGAVIATLMSYALITSS